MSKLYLIGNSHLDPVWLWRWQDGFSEILATFRSALDRMKEFPDYKYTSACAVYYQWVEKIDPGMFEEIRERVQEGRWNIVGGWFLQPDCNIPCGESFARHGLISQRYFKDRFGITAQTGYNVDSFGHNASLPKILKSSGMDNYVFTRPSCAEQGVNKSLFMWESDDGSQVCAYRIPYRYNLDLRTLDLFEELRKKADEEDMDYMCFFGIGNHGGGLTIRLLDEIEKMDLGEHLYSVPDEYFATVNREKLPVIKDELQHHARGCYSVGSFVKINNRKCEQNLLAAEAFCTMAKNLVGEKYPREKLNKAWKNLLFNQFHDILAGCVIKSAEKDAGYLYGEIMSITEQVMQTAMQKMAWKINTLQGEDLPVYKVADPHRWALWEHEVLGTPVVIFNSHAWPVRQMVEIIAVAKKMTDVNGNEIPFQIVRAEHTNGTEDKYATTFVAEVPAYGYTVYRIFGEKEQTESFEAVMKAEDKVLENDVIRVELDSFTGDIRSIYDKMQQKYIVNHPCKAVMVDETACDTWAHNKERLGCTVGMLDTHQFHVIEVGDIRATIRVTTYYGKTVLQRDYTVIRGMNEVKVKVKVDFHEQHKALKFTFPLTEETVKAQIPYGTVTRKGYTGEESCGAWFASGAMCVANDCKHGYDTEDGEVRMTILRGAIYADHYGERDEFCEYMEQGIHEFTYSIFPYESNTVAEKRTAELNFGLRMVIDTFHDGTLPETKSCFKEQDGHIVVTAIKRAEDDENVVVRFFEADGVDTKVSFRIFDSEISTSVSHNEIKTFKTDEKEVNMIEW